MFHLTLDNKQHNRTHMYRCSVDPYLFENFNTVDGDFLTAKFRAFKFPESTYVQFRGTVNVCLDKCQGVWFILFIYSERVRARAYISAIIKPVALTPFARSLHPLFYCFALSDVGAAS